ncbi:MAG: ABC transporter ATP-binding protein [Proteobacteria bacterium]|nr:ABC transporter ATP-binding protein [Pseudomonadota bacterium]
MLLELDNVAGRYGRNAVLHGVSAAVGAGELVALVGSNGAGKTTLLRVISGVGPASTGRIRFAGHDIARLAPDRRVRLGIAQVPEGRQVFAPQSVDDNLRLGGFTRPRRALGPELERIYALLPALAARRRQLAGTLSGGEQQMLAIGRALMAAPKLLLLDEPSLGLAPLVVAAVFRLIADLKRAGTTILLVEQNAQAALAIADRGYVIETGRLVLEDTGTALLANPRVREAYLGV